MINEIIFRCLKLAQIEQVKISFANIKINILNAHKLMLSDKVL